MPHAHHLHDDRLFDCYFAVRHGEALDPRVAEHLADCEACGSRYGEIALLFDRLGEDGEAAADAVFTSEQLRAQHQQIMARLERLGRAARIISFPGQLINRTVNASRAPTTPRWIAAAAAAGLVAGVALSASYQWASRAQPAGGISARVETSAPPQTALTAVATDGREPAPEVAADDAFWSELEVALERPRTRELQPLDVLTPHVRDITDLR
jgi:hypothetical protein